LSKDATHPGAWVPAVDGEADGLEAELARVLRAGEKRGADVVPGSAPPAIVGHRVPRRRREKSAAVGGRVEDEEAGVDRLGERRGRLEKQEALVAVVELEVGGSRGEVKGEARRGGVVVEWSEDGVVVAGLAGCS
jgi:hypothetical protein